MNKKQKEEQILKLYNQKRVDLQKEQERNEQKISLQEKKIEQIYYLNNQIRSLVDDINASAGETDWKFLSYFEKQYEEVYRRELEMVNDEKESMMVEKKRFYDLEDEYKRECNIELAKIKDEIYGD